MPIRSVLFVCLGNICRSPLAEGVFRQILHDHNASGLIEVDSAGTGPWHIGEKPDPRSIKTARNHNIDLNALRGREVVSEDFERFDLILAMDDRNLSDLRSRSLPQYHDKIHLFLNYTIGQDVAIPDPYCGGQDGFETVYNVLRMGCDALFTKLSSDKDNA